MNKIISTPLARALAAKLGINIEQVTGTGPNGRVLKADVESFKAQPAPAVQATTPVAAAQPASAPLAPTPRPVFNDELKASREKTTPIRKAIARAMKNSWDNVAYVNLVHEIDVTDLWDLRKKIVENVLKLTGQKITFLPFIAKAVAIALREFPILTAKYDEQNQELVYPGTINLGIAVDSEDGLKVPVVKNANQLSILDISSEIVRLAGAARNKTIKPDEMRGGDFTITNYGSVGSLFGVPVINYPEVAIAGVGAIVDKPVVRNGAVVPGKVMYITVAADHRWVDGAVIGRFASRVKELLEKPEILGVF
ncbi:2-oxo acid dehydrogenase subunit E2 [Candidatus Mycoplasma pogonae]